MWFINFIVRNIEYILPFIGVILTGIGLKLSTIIAPIDYLIPDELLQLELDLAFNILILFIIKNKFSIKNHCVVNSTFVNPGNSTNNLTLEKIKESPSNPKEVELNIQIYNADTIKKEIYLEIRYGKNVEVSIDEIPVELIFKQDHQNKNIKITLNTLFNFRLAQLQEETLNFKVLSNRTSGRNSSMELHISSSAITDRFKIKNNKKDMKINIK